MRKTTKIFIPIPKIRNTQIKVEINGDDRTGRVVESLWAYPATLGIGTFKVVLSNSHGQLSNLYSAGDSVKFYADNSDGSTLQFWGIIDYVKDDIGSKGQFLEIEGRHRSYLLTEFLVCYSATGKTTSDILKDIIGKLPMSYGFTESNIEDESTTMDVEWNYKPFWDCVVELCNRGGSDCYVDNDLDFHYFKKNSKMNDREFVAEGTNFLNSKNLGVDKYYEKSRVIAMGASSGGLPIVYTAVSPIEGTDIKEILVKDTSSNTMESVKSLAEAKLLEVTNKNLQGVVESFGLDTLKPGETIWIVIPRQKIYGQYKIIQINNKFGSKSGGWRTGLFLEEEEKGISNNIQNLNEKSDRAIEAENINKLDFSLNFDFSSDVGTHSNTVIEEGVLRTGGSSTGVWTSDLVEVSSDVSFVELKLNGTILGGLKIYLSTDGGVSHTLIYGVGASLASLTPGRKLKLRVNIASASTEINDLALLYS